MHVGHIRSTVLGDALGANREFPRPRSDPRQSHRRLGNAVRDGDLRLEKSARSRGPGARSDRGTGPHLQGDQRIEPETIPPCATPAASELVKLQAGDEENLRIWNECVALSMREFEGTYQLLDIHYDIQRGESFYNDRLPGVVERLLKSRIAEISEGAVCRFLSRHSRAGRQTVHHSQRATAVSITPPPTSRRLIIESTI